MDKSSVNISVEEAKQALRDAFEKKDNNAIFFWTGYLLALSS